MRKSLLLATVLVLAACSGAKRSEAPASSEAPGGAAADTTMHHDTTMARDTSKKM